jgi:GH24 family phage-related lysozyme (muramidase)
MFKIITSCICAAAIVFGSITYDPLANWLATYEKKFEWVADSTIELITGFEGFRTKAYQDINGRWTTGVGHLIRSEDRYMLHRELSEAEVIAILHQDLKKCSDALESALKVMVNRAQADALHSLCHNIGPDRMVRSEVVKYLNEGDQVRAANAFMNWTNPGLKKRRQAEKALFLAAE